MYASTSPPPLPRQLPFSPHGQTVMHISRDGRRAHYTRSRFGLYYPISSGKCNQSGRRRAGSLTLPSLRIYIFFPLGLFVSLSLYSLRRNVLTSMFSLFGNSLNITKKCANQHVLTFWPFCLLFTRKCANQHVPLTFFLIFLFVTKKWATQVPLPYWHFCLCVLSRL